MKTLTILYILNATLLLLHEIESAYEREWEILRLPGGITGFLIIHVPIIVFFFYGLIEIEKSSPMGAVFGIITGTGGVIPFIVHKVAVKKDDRFNLAVSNAIIFLNIPSGLGLLVLSVLSLN